MLYRSNQVRDRIFGNTKKIKGKYIAFRFRMASELRTRREIREAEKFELRRDENFLFKIAL